MLSVRGTLRTGGARCMEEEKKFVAHTTMDAIIAPL
jgi:hypothetical protein